MSELKPESADINPQETREWVESIDGVVNSEGRPRAQYLLNRVLEQSWRRGVFPSIPLNTAYVNTIPRNEEPSYPGDFEIEKQIRRIIRWNAVVMVHGANKKFPGIGGHLSSFASSATLYETGFNHFFGGNDQIYFQGHTAPGIYSRSFLEGRIPMDAMERFRREAERGEGLSSYPHPRLMPNYWQFPTVSMGLGPIAAIYQARFNRYLQARSFKDTSESRVWCFMGDGESDEPESLGSLSIAAREKLDNLTFVVNCNLQRLDGPVRGNGKIVQELEAVFRGAGWNVIKLLWGPEWDELFANDTDGLLQHRVLEVVDGQWQKYTTAPGSYIRKHLFGSDPRLLQMVSHLSDDQIRDLRRGGHSYRKVFAAFQRAVNHKGQPTVILAQTVKGWTLGEGFEGSNNTHQKKKMEMSELREFRDLLELPIPDDKLDEAPFYHPGPNSPEVKYVLERRAALGGTVPRRRDRAAVSLNLPTSKLYDEFYEGMPNNGEASTTMVFARLLSKLIRDKGIGRRVVPIIPDEARTFGMDALFSQVGIYASRGQLYEPVDKGKLLYYRESNDGQVLEEGITEAGSMASFIAAATSYSVHGEPLIPFYVFYSMFGFQRTGDQIWQASDAMARGFLLGATAGRTTLNGEGLQHEDGHSQIMASLVPHVEAYDVTFAYELAAIVEDGLHRMYHEEENVLYYITLQNESYAMPPMPEGARDGILKGLYRFSQATEKAAAHVQLIGSGSIFNEVRRGAQILWERYGVSSDVWSATSYKRLRNEALSAERHNRLHPEDEPVVPYVTEVLKDVEGPVIAASDYVKLLPEHIARWVPRRFVVLGTDGFGMSDTREALRRHFEVDGESVALAAIEALVAEGKLERSVLVRAVSELGINPDKVDPLEV